jgi:inner membrane protein
MDSVTQILLGATVAELAIGKAIGRRAALYGAVLGTVPDLDVIINYGGPVENFTYHRGFSHSLFVLTAASPVIGWALHKMFGQASLKHWIFMVWLVLITHPLLDAMTVYGTQLFWPITEYPVSGSSLFIIDPAYTIWLLIGVLAVIFMRRAPETAYRINAVMLGVATAYIGWSWMAKSHVIDVAARALERQGIAYTQLLSTPAPFNTLLWRFVAMHPDGNYSEGYYSLFDGTREVKFDRYESKVALLDPVRGEWPVERLKWFTHGFYKVAQNSPAVVISDLRMGVEGNYVFNFKVGDILPGGETTVANERVRTQRGADRLPLVWDRIWDRSVSLAP